MAYTIISQNNTTTTLSDENGNVITVPARVTLATSTDYTIIKVNNNSVDLESGDGKIIRGVPACVVLAGEGGGSGESYLPLTGGTLTGNLEMSDSKVQFNNTSYTFSYWLDAYLSGHLRIGKSSSVDTGDLFISTGSGGDKIIAFGESGGSVGSVNAKLERVYTQKLNNGADIAVPTTGGTMVLQESTMPTAASGNEGLVIQYVGTTDANYTNGYFYKCVSDGQDPATYSWTRVDIQPAGATYTAGNGISIDANNEISVAAPTLVNKASVANGLIIDNSYVQATNYNSSVSVGYSNTPGAAQGVIVGVSSSTTGSGGVALGYNTKAGAYGVAIGRMARANANYAIQLGGDNATNNNPDANTFKVGNANGNFELMNANGNLPADRLASTTGLADGNYRLRLVMASGVPTLEWVAE